MIKDGAELMPVFWDKYSPLRMSSSSCPTRGESRNSFLRQWRESRVLHPVWSIYGIGPSPTESKVKSAQNADTIVSGDLTSGMAVDGDAREILLKTNENVFGSFVFRIDSSGSFEPYWPFLCNLANYVALSLENRMQKILLEGKNQKLEEMNRLFIGRELRMKELKDKIAELEKKVHAED